MSYLPTSSLLQDREISPFPATRMLNKQRWDEQFLKFTLPVRHIVGFIVDHEHSQG